MARRLALLSLFIALRVIAADHPPAGDEHLVRLGEAFRIADTVGARVWSGFSVNDAPIVLITESTEYLLNSNEVASGFVETKQHFRDRPVFVRARVFPTGLLASFPAIGRPAVVVGTPLATKHDPAAWTIVILHELFHVYQEQQGMSEKVAELQIGPREEGQWQLDYPFPYTDERIGTALNVLGHEIQRTLQSQDDLDENGEAVASALKTAMELVRLAEPQSKSADYMKFVASKEGVARYFEYRVAKDAAERYEPSAAFAKLDGADAFAKTWKARYEPMPNAIRKLGRNSRNRVEFYTLGLGLGLLLDRLEPDWQRDYFKTSPWLDAKLVSATSARLARIPPHASH